MERLDRSPGPAVFELSVEGTLGPVLRAALRPRTVVERGECTVLRTLSHEHDLVELVRIMVAAGLRIESVRSVAVPRGKVRSPTSSGA
jgi:hypothetical protein